MEVRAKTNDHKQASPSAELRSDSLAFGIFADRLHIVLFELDPQGRLGYISESARGITGYSPDELSGELWKEVLFPAKQLSAEDLNAVFDQDLSGREVKLTAKDGKILVFELTTARSFDSEGNLLSIQGAAVDISRFKEASKQIVSKQAGELKLADQRVHVSEEQLRGIVNSVKDYAIYTLDTDGNITSWNIGAETIKGYRAEEVIGKNYSRFFPEEAQQLGEPQQALQAAVQNGRHEEDALRVRKDGTTFWANVVLSPIRDMAGNLIGFSKVTRDMTRRKNREEMLHRQTEYIRLLQDVAVAANEAVDVEDALDYSIRRICDQTGWNIGHSYLIPADKIRKEAPSTGIWYLDDPERFGMFREKTDESILDHEKGLIGKVYSTSEPYWIADAVHDPYFLRKGLAAEVGIHSGIAFPILVGKSVVGILEFFSAQQCTPDEQLIQVVTQIGTQLGRVIERKWAESDLRESENKFRTIFEGAALGIELLDLEGRLLESNHAATEMLGYQADELRRISRGDVNHPANLIANIDFFDELRAGMRDSFRVEKPFIRKDGRLAWGRLSVSLVRDAGGMPEFAIAMLEDITERRQMEAELLELQRSLMEGRESERLSLAQELHDGPVQDLYGLTFQMKAYSESLPEDIRNQVGEYQQMMTSVITTLRSICKDLRPPTLAPFGLEKAIRSHAEQFMEDRPFDIELQLMADGQSLPESMRLALFRIYQQTLVNIARHAQAKRIWVRFRFDEDTVELEIEDDGRGFVVPNRWVDLARRGHLGLVGAVERAESIGGKLTVESAPGSGTKVIVKVPRRTKAKQNH